MRLKSYFSGTVEAAMALARKEMGDDAMLIHSRPSQPEARHLGAYEVVFGTYGVVSDASENRIDPKPSESRPGPVAVAKRIEASTPENALTQQVSQLRREMERMLESLVRQSEVRQSEVRQNSPASPETTPASPERTEEASLPAAPHESAEDSMYQWLVKQELDSPLAREVARGKPLEGAFHVNPVLGRESGLECSGSKQAIVALIGPPGAGKTTTLAKLAARHGLGWKRAHILSADVLRIGAADQLRTLASLLGMGFGLAETPVEMDRMIEEQYNKDLILIDTPGLGMADMEDCRELARMIGSDPEIDTHLVLPASMKADDLARQVDVFREFRPRKLIFTRMDETSRYGSLLSLAARTGLEVSFLACGQRIPDDLEAATKKGLVKLLAIPPDLRAACDIEAVPMGRGAAA